MNVMTGVIFWALLCLTYSVVNAKPPESVNGVSRGVFSAQPWVQSTVKFRATAYAARRGGKRYSNRQLKALVLLVALLFLPVTVYLYKAGTEHPLFVPQKWVSSATDGGHYNVSANVSRAPLVVACPWSETALALLPKQNSHRFELLAHQAPVKMMVTRDARFYDVESPKETNVPLNIPPQTRRGRWVKQYGVLHANYINISGQNTTIAAQYPSERTLDRGRFWRMCMQQKITTIIDLTIPGESGLTPYYPDNVGDSRQYNGIEIISLSEQGQLNHYQVKDLASGKVHELRRYQPGSWQDHGEISLGEFSSLTDFAAELDDLLIHCHGGIGRTMTLYAAIELKKQFTANPLKLMTDINSTVDRVIRKMRRERGPFAIEAEQQRLLLINLVLSWLRC